jgi:hypothetical protein
MNARPSCDDETIRWEGLIQTESVNEFED